MDDHANHIQELDKKITALSDALAKLGQGSSLKELIRIIHFPGYTSVAEVAFMHGILDAMHGTAAMMAKMEADLLAASKQVQPRG